MDVRVKFWMRSWFMGTSTAMLLGPGMVVAQVKKATTKPLPPQSATQPSLLQPSPNAVSLAAHEAGEGDGQLAETEVEARLRELYERDGREMPNITLAPSSAPAQSQNPSQQAAPANQPRYSPAAPTAPPTKPQNRVSGFFKKLVPGMNKKPPVQPPRQLQATNPQQPIAPSNPSAVQPAIQPAVQPQVAAQPRSLEQSQAVAQPQSIPVTRSASQPPMRPQTQASRPSATARPPVAPAIRPSSTTSPQTPTATRSVPQFTEAAQPAPIEAPESVPQMGEPEITFESEELDADDMELDDLNIDEQPAALPAPAETPTAASPGFDEEFPDPFAGTEEAEGSSEPIENPYTGQTLEPLEAPAALPVPTIAPRGRIDRTSMEETTAMKMRRIVQRSDIKGLKGFCPVTLRDQRELADSRPEFVATYRGQKFYCASKVAQEKFVADPARYAPAAYGADVVVLTDDQDVAEGTLDYAAWYKGRLYLFSGQETHDTFTTNPERYASPPGIE